MHRYASPLVGKTIDWRAGCGRSARPFGGRGDRTQSVLPTPIILPPARAGREVGPGFRRGCVYYGRPSGTGLFLLSVRQTTIE